MSWTEEGTRSHPFLVLECEAARLRRRGPNLLLWVACLDYTSFVESLTSSKDQHHRSDSLGPRRNCRRVAYTCAILAGLSASYAGVTPHVYDANHSHANSSCMIPKTGTIELLWPTSHTQKEICCSCPSAGGREKSPRRLCLARSPPGHPCQGKLSITP
jgi:hypothetical protein